MESLTAFWASQPVFVVTIALLIFGMSLSRFGTRILARWLGLTDTNARRFTRAITIGIWLFVFLLVSFVRIGIWIPDIFGLR